jgi:hypothetical protein
MGMKRPDAGAAPNGAQAARDAVLSGFYPTLTEWLTETTWDDGKPRKTATLLLLTENGRWKAFLHDRDLKRGFWMTGDAYEGLLAAIEEGLTKSSVEWRKDTR